MGRRGRPPIREIVFHCSPDEMFILGDKLAEMANVIAAAKRKQDCFKVVFEFDRRHVDGWIDFGDGKATLPYGAGVGWLTDIIPAAVKLGNRLKLGACTDRKVSVTWVRDREPRDHSIRE